MKSAKIMWKLCLSMLIIYLVFKYFHIYVTESPIAYSVPDKCQKKSVKECFPHDMTFLVYNNNVSPSSMNFKQGFSITEYISSLLSYTGTAANSISKMNFEKMNLQRDCAIIGNGGILTGSNCGKNINKHDFVIRSNLAPIENYEEDVGVKANITVLNTSIIKQVTNTINQINGSQGDKFLRRIRYLNNSILWYSKDTRVKFKTNNKLLTLIKLLKDKYKLGIRFAYSWKSVGPLVQWFWDIDVRHPTTGLNMFTVAASLCNSTTLYGFYPFYNDTKGNPLQYHYYDKRNVNLQAHKTHNMPREYELLKKLNQSGFLSLVTDCGQ
ncbi:alpha-2,8-sialyltransferase 8B-like isoform X2 [Anneissia japonica]|uniref:alpha-2,8-sialyltransferase 8B-like isoform X2 n=1 Tax=Anneissia japonica TaxID=1529436 RepID=UPI0014256434|nr:alpha-2,8-sialyltransferase 8B-like isoform X2 [Anneissia japonica]